VLENPPATAPLVFPRFGGTPPIKRLARVTSKWAIKMNNSRMKTNFNGK
jgi:hypothetical protein